MKKVLAGYMFFMVFNTSAFCQSPEKIDKSKKILTQIFIDSANDIHSELHKDVWKLYTPSVKYVKHLLRQGIIADFDMKNEILSKEVGAVILKHISETSTGKDSIWVVNNQLFTLLISLPRWFLNGKLNNTCRGLFLVECKKTTRWMKEKYKPGYEVENEEDAEKTYIITKVKSYKIKDI